MHARLFVSVVIALAAAPSAQAAFSGTNGLLVAQPASGRGLVTIDPRTGASRRICQVATQCGRPIAPRWAPNGRQIASIDANTGRVVVTTSTGACVACDTDRPLTSIRMKRVAFSGDSTTLVAAGAAGGVYVIRFSAADDRPVSPATVDEIATASSGEVAAVVNGSIWLGNGGVASDPWGRGTSVSLPPRGFGLAFVRHGWVWLSNVGHTALRRLVRGTAPAFSPDGRAVAYIGPGGMPYVIALKGGKPRRIARVRVRTLDWGPRPTSVTACNPPAGTIISRTDSAIIWKGTTLFDGVQVPAFYGCAIAVGITYGLGAVTTGIGIDGGYVHAIALAGTYAAVATHTDNRYVGASDALVVIDLRNDHVLHESDDLCHSSSGCSALDSLQVNANADAAWHMSVAGDPPYTQTTEQVMVADDNGVRAVDTVTGGDGHTLTNVVLGPDSVTWDNAGVPHSAPLQ